MITVTPIEQIGADDRGSNYQFSAEGRSGQYIFCYRNAGSSSGQHYHTGAAAGKNPEILYLVSGKVSIHWCPLEGKEIAVTYATAPAKIVVPINIWHQLIAETDCSFMELNSLADVQLDSVRIWREDFEKMINK
jgi:hypothetical protein